MVRRFLPVLSFLALAACAGHIAWQFHLMEKDDVIDAFIDPSTALHAYASKMRTLQHPTMSITQQMGPMFAMQLIGAYVAVLPIYVGLWATLRHRFASNERKLFLVNLGSISGLVFLVVGGMGSAILTRRVPFELEAYLAAPNEHAAKIREAMYVALSEFVHHSFWGCFATLFASMWYGCVGTLFFSDKLTKTNALFGVLSFALALANMSMWIHEVFHFLLPVWSAHVLFFSGLVFQLGVAPIWNVFASFYASCPSCRHAITTATTADKKIK